MKYRKKPETMTCPGCGHTVYKDPMDGWRNDSDRFTCEPLNTTHSQHILEPKGDEQ